MSAVPPDSSSSELANVPSDDNEQRRLNLNSESKGLPGGADKHAGRVVFVSSRDKKLFAICVIQLNHRSFDGETTGAIWTLHLGERASRWQRRVNHTLALGSAPPPRLSQESRRHTLHSGRFCLEKQVLLGSTNE